MSRLPCLVLVVVLSACGGSATPGLAAGSDAGSDAGTASFDGGTGFDAGAGADAGALETDAGLPRCTFSNGAVSCPPNITSLLGRDVYWQTPSSPAPPAGYPAVIVYQGSFFSPASSWGEVLSSAPFAGFQQARLQALLLERGFTVIAPSALAGLAWETNSGLPWDSTSDKTFVDGLLEAMRLGTFGPVDPSRRYATGISSGGYMTSRMAVSYPGVFRALAINSGSYATCAGFACLVPTTMPVQHPPTRFLHGRTDVTVPLYTAEPYQQRLTAQGFEADLIVDESAGHEWLSVAPERILEWFQGH